MPGIRLYKVRERWFWKVMGEGRNALALGSEGYKTAAEARRAVEKVYGIMTATIEKK